MNDFLSIENCHLGEVLHLRRAPDEHGQTVLLMDGTMPPKTSGPPLHVHFLQREEVVVESGTLGVRYGKESQIFPPGGSAVFPAGVAHTWWNAGDDILKFRIKAVPAVDLDRYLQAAFAVLNASRTGKPSAFYAAHVLWRHRHSQALAFMPRPLQWVLFPLVLLVGRMLGKYRGTAWPGSPQTCTGAPEAAATAPA